MSNDVDNGRNKCKIVVDLKQLSQGQASGNPSVTRIILLEFG